MVMSLPVSQYEALLAEVRGLRQKAQRVQQLARPLLQGDSSPGASSRTFRPHSPPGASYSLLQNDSTCEPLDYTMESLLLGRQHNNAGSPNYENGVTSSVEGDTTCSEDEYGGARSSTKMSVSSEPVTRNRGMLSLYHGTWPVEKTMWNSEPARLGAGSNQPVRNNMNNQMEVTSVMSFASSSGGVPLDRVLGSPDRTSKWSSQQLEAKMDVVHSLLAMLGGQEHVDMGETLLALSTCPESCLAMRQSGCIPLLVQLVQSDRDGDTRRKASQALHNLVNSQPDEKLRKRESRILKLLEQCRGYTEALRNNTEYEQPESSSSSEVDGDKHPVQTVAHLMKLSFDEGHRQAICQLGGIHTIASLVEAEHTLHGSISDESHCILMRRYACMALTNLTFGDSGNKALLCSFREFMRALVVQLQSPSDELRQVTASVLRNLSWRADSTSKEILREVGSVSGLMKSAMVDNKENTLKSILSALWNLSAHCTENKSEICAVEGALGFLVDMLTYKTPSKSMAIIENSGGILRNISSQIAVREDYREVLRSHNCLQILLDQLKSPSLTIVSNACGTLWNLSAKCSVDQEALWQMGAPAMLRSLNHSKHKMIAMGSSAALKNLLTSRPQQTLLPQMDSTALSLDLPALPTLGARKQKALMQDLDQNLSETYENIEKDSPVKKGERDGTIIDFMQDSHRKQKMRSTSPDYLKYESTSRSNPSLDEEHLSNTFASLNLNEPSTSYMSEARPKSRIPQSFGSSSLPYMTPPIKRTNPCTYIPVRNKFSDCAYEDEIVSDQPIDYSQKYSETKLPNNDANNVSSSKDRDNFSYNKSKTEKENFSIYAETDLDQPTDYSLRYAEDDSDSDICNKITESEPQEYVQDTVKTYCTEDTPYETPFNFSTATSMSDLRMDEKPVIDNDKLKESSPKTNKEVSKNVDEKDHCSTEDISEIDNRPKMADKIPKSELSSGLMSPEKPVNYCEEGTPGYFSRVSSFGSLNSIPANEATKNESKGNDSLPLEVESEREEKQVEKTPPKTPSETKAVKFEQVVNYAEETPLMFSRSSSLASLDSIEQHSIHDDRSSVVSDLSRLTSGIVSPSELPDSPTQTVPPSPKPRKTPLEFPNTSSKPRTSTENRPQPAPRILAKPSVFEDNITKFKEESTPIQFSTATSLSSLTIDDHEEQNNSRASEAKQHSEHSSAGSLMQKEDEAEKKDSEKETNTFDGNDEFVPESEDEGDEDILAACINIGKQKNRHNQTNPQTPPTTSKLPLSSFKYTPKMQCNRSIISPRNIPQPNVTRPAGMDTLRMYCTEDTPALLSRAGSNSDLSILSIPNDNKAGSRGDYLSDDGSNFSGDSENILAECIQAGIRAKRESPISSTKPMSCLPRRSEQSSTPVKYNPSGNSRRGSADGSRAPSIDINKRDNYMSGRDELDGLDHQRNFSPRSSELVADSSRRDYLSDDGSILSGDSENILAECIQAGMQKTTRESPKPSLKPASCLPRRSIQTSTTAKYNSSGGSRRGSGEVSRAPSTELNKRDNCLPPYTSARDELESYAVENSPSHFPVRSNRPAGSISRADYLSDDSSNLSGDNDILAECIQAGMSKVNRESPKPNLKPASCLPRRSEQTNTPVRYNPSGNSRREASKVPNNDINRRDNSLPPYLTSRDELESYAVENSPGHFSLRSSLSDLTVDGSIAGLKRSPQSNNQLLDCSSNTQTSGSTAPPLANLNISEETDSETDQAILKECILAGMPKQNPVSSSKPVDIPNGRSSQPNNQLQHSSHDVQSSESTAQQPANISISEETDSEAEQAMLRECIIAGMPKENPVPSSKPIDIPNTRSIQPSGSTARRSANLSLSLETDLSEEAERAMLQECILAGMPKNSSDLSAKPVDVPNTRSVQPNNQLQRSSRSTQPTGSTAQQRVNLNISEETDSEAEQILLRECILAGMPKEKSVAISKPLNIPNTRSVQSNNQLQRSSRNTPPSRSAAQPSANLSLALETDLSEEAERAMLQECILAGMPKTNPGLSTRPVDVPNSRSNTKKTMGKSSSRYQLEEEAKPKNVSAASAAGSTIIQASVVRPDMTPAVAGVEENPEPETGTKIRTHGPTQPEKTETLTDTLQDKCLHSEENFSTGLEKSGSSKSLGKILDAENFDDMVAEFSFPNSDNMVIEDCLARSCEDSKAVDNRMLDPDAMIESLDRFTAELVSQASHLNKDEDKYKVSTGDNTWNEDTSPNEVTFPSISGSVPNVITFSHEDDSNKLDVDVVDGINGSNEPDIPSNDFSSLNTSTMTESTLIAIEASKMATVFKNEAEMSLSITSAASLELDHVQPPSHLNSLTNSTVGLEKIIPKSPKLIARKKSLPAGLMVRRALSNSLNHGSSLESLENHSLSNLDQVNPPTDLLRDVFDLEGSMTSVASLPSENDVKADFVINGILNKDPQNNQHPIFNLKQPFNGSHYNELENINPPSLFNEITDFCNSLADIGTETICSETDIFEDCYTHMADTTLLDENVTLAEDEATVFSDAHSGTPLQSDLSSADSTPKRLKNLSKSMTTKQRRNLARDRYKTYTVAAEMVMREEGEKQRENSEATEDFKTVLEHSQRSTDDTTYVSPTYSVSSPKLTPKERRQMNRSRFETQVLDEAITSILQQPVIETPPPDSPNQSCDSNSCSSSPAQSPARTKLSIRRNFMQKRLENKDRFRTQTLSESSFSPEVSSASPPLINGEAELHLHLQKEADLVLRTLRDTKTTQDELLDCETLSLVSNDDDSEHNSGGSVNYRTYHKSWGFRKNNIPIINSENNNQNGLVNCQSNLANDPENLPDDLNTTVQYDNSNSEHSEEENEQKTIGRPKIVKPGEKRVEPVEDPINEEEIKGIRGRRKPLYLKSNINNKIAPKSIKPVKTMTSNLVKNVTSTLKSGTALKSVVSKPAKTVAQKPPTTQSRVSSGYGSKPLSNSNSPKTSPARVPSTKSSPKHSPAVAKQQTTTPKGTPPMERQGTFTKDEPSPSGIPKPGSKIPTPASATKIPAFASKIARSGIPSKLPSSTASKPPTARNGYVKSASSDRANKNMRVYNRSTSADSREPVRKMQTSPSSQSLKNDGRMQNGAVKKSSIPSPAQRSNSNTSLNSNGSSSTKKQVTSKIASLWKKIEDSKKQPPKKDTRVWIQPESEPDPPRLIRSNTFDNKDGVILRSKAPEDGDPTKRVSRLGSFIIMDESEDGIRLQQAISAAATTNGV